MAKNVIYLCAPVSGDPLGNCAKAEAWLRWLFLHDPGTVYVAPWIGEVRALQSAEALYVDGKVLDWRQGGAAWLRALSDDLEVVRRLDGILLVGGRITEGMRLERDAALKAGKLVLDMSHLETPRDLEATLSQLNENFSEYAWGVSP